MKKQISFVNIVLIFISLVFFIFWINANDEKSELAQANKELKIDLISEKEVSKIYDLTETFIKKSSIGKHGSLLTGFAKDEYKKALEVSHDHTDYESDVLDSVEIINVSAIKEGTDKAKSYAIYKVSYNNNPNSDAVTTQRIIYLTLIAKWEKINKGYKVYEYKIDLLKDSLDEYLKEIK